MQTNNSQTTYIYLHSTHIDKYSYLFYYHTFSYFHFNSHSLTHKRTQPFLKKLILCSIAMMRKIHFPSIITVRNCISLLYQCECLINTHINTTIEGHYAENSTESHKIIIFILSVIYRNIQGQSSCGKFGELADIGNPPEITYYEDRFLRR